MPFCVIFSQWHNVYEFDDSMNMYYLGLQAAKGYLIVGMEDKMFWTLSRWVVNLHKFLNLYMWSWGEACQRRIIVLLISPGTALLKDVAAGKTPCPGLCRKSRYQDDALCDPFYAADRRIYSLLADCPGRSAWAGSCHCAVRLKFTHAGIVVAGQAFCNAITPCNP